MKNKLLLALPKNERAILYPALVFLPLPVGTTLADKNAAIKFGYFLNDGLASVLSVMKAKRALKLGCAAGRGLSVCL